MKKIFAVAFLAYAVLSVSAHASFISGHHLTSDGRPVALQGLEWMPLAYTAGLSRQQVEGPSGFTDRFGGIWKSNDWRYASRLETEALLGSLWGGVYNGFSTDNYSGAYWFISHFGGLAFDTWNGYQRTDGKKSNGAWVNHDFSNFLFGNDMECADSRLYSCFGSVEVADAYAYKWYDYNVITQRHELSHLGGTGMGWFYESAGVNMKQYSNNDYVQKASFPHASGSLLVRLAPLPPAAVQSPSSISVFALALFGLILSSRYKASQRSHTRSILGRFLRVPPVRRSFG